MLTQDDSDSNAQVNQRRHSPPHTQQGLAAVGQSQMSTVPACSNEVRVSHARVFGRPASTNGSEVATERDPVDSTIRDGTVYRPTLADTSEIQSVEPPRQRRRLVLLQEPRRAPSARDVSGSDRVSTVMCVMGSQRVMVRSHTEETPSEFASLGHSRRVEEFGRGRFGGNFREKSSSLEDRAEVSPGF